MIAALLLLLSPGAAPAQDAAGVKSDPVVLVADGREITRSRYAAWLLRTRGELNAREFARLWRLRRLAEEHGIRFEAASLRAEAVRGLDERIEAAFRGDRARWEAELAREGRSPAGLLAQRVLALEAEGLPVALTEGTHASRRELLEEVDGPFEFHPETWRADDARVPVMTVDGVPIPRRTFSSWLLAARGEQNARRMAESLRIEAAAAEAGIELTRTQLEERVRDDLARVIEHEHRGDRGEWTRALRQTGRSEEQFLRELAVRKRLELMVEGLVLREREVRPDDLRREWTERYGENGRRIELRWIRIDAGPDEELEDARAEARDLRRRIEAGEDFATLAERHSDDGATRIRGGRPGANFRLRHLPTSLVEPVRALGAGQVSPPLVEDRSVWLIEVTRIVKTPFDEVRATLLEELRTRRPTEVELAARRNVLVRDVEVRVLPAMFSG